MAVITLFWKFSLGLSMQQIFLLQGCFGLVMACFEFPSGYIADRLGYRTSLLAAAVLNLVGWSIYLFADSFLALLLAEAVLGIGMSLISGTDAALMYESLLETDREHRYASWAGKMRFWGQFGEGSAALLAGVLWSIHPRSVFAMQLLVWTVNVFVALAMKEPVRHRPDFVESRKQIRHLVDRVFRQDPVLRALILLLTALGLSSFIPVWTVQLYAVESGMHPVLLGPLWAAANYSVALGSLAGNRVGKRLGTSGLIGLCMLLIAIGYGGMAIVPFWWGVFFYLSLTTMRGLFAPTLTHLEQRRLTSRDRAGMLSLRSLGFRLTFFAIAPAVGAAIDGTAQRRLLAVIGTLLLVAVGTSWMIWRRAMARETPSG